MIGVVVGVEDMGWRQPSRPSAARPVRRRRVHHRARVPVRYNTGVIVRSGRGDFDQHDRSNAGPNPSAPDSTLNRLPVRMTYRALDVPALSAFYESPVGQRTRRLILRRLRRPGPTGRAGGCWASASPALSRRFLGEAERAIAAVPAGWVPRPGRRGIAPPWSRKRRCLFPMPLRSGWWCTDWKRPRLSGRCCANCGGYWRRKAGCWWWRPTAPACGRSSTSPFGHGRPFSRSQLEVLRGALFVPEHWELALYAPPLGTAPWPARRRLGTGRRGCGRARWRPPGGSEQVDLRAGAARSGRGARAFKSPAIPPPPAPDRHQVMHSRKMAPWAEGWGRQDSGCASPGPAVTSSASALSIPAPILRVKSTKSAIVHRWMLGVSYQA